MCDVSVWFASCMLIIFTYHLREFAVRRPWWLRCAKIKESPRRGNCVRRAYLIEVPILKHTLTHCLDVSSRQNNTPGGIHHYTGHAGGQQPQTRDRNTFKFYYMPPSDARRSGLSGHGHHTCVGGGSCGSGIWTLSVELVSCMISVFGWLWSIWCGFLYAFWRLGCCALDHQR